MVSFIENEWKDSTSLKNLLSPWAYDDSNIVSEDVGMTKFPIRFENEDEYVNVMKAFIMEELKAQIVSLQSKTGKYREVRKTDGPWTTGENNRFRSITLSGSYDELKDEKTSVVELLIDTKAAVSIKLIGTLLPTKSDFSKSLHFEFYTRSTSTNLIYVLQAYTGRCNIRVLMPLVSNRREYESLMEFHTFNTIGKKIILDTALAGIPSSERKEEGVTLLSSRFRNEHIPKMFNNEQIKAICAAVSEDQLPFTLIQGPPGTGKTHTIMGILNTFHLVADQKYKKAIMDQIKTRTKKNRELNDINWLKKPRILVCAPSNSATNDILYKYVKKGFVSSDLEEYKPTPIRVGFNSQTPIGKAVGLDMELDGYLKTSNEEVVMKIKQLEKLIASSSSKITELQIDGDDTREGRSLTTEQLNKLYEMAIERERYRRELSRYELVRRSRSAHAINQLQESCLKEATLIFTTVSGCRERILERLGDVELVVIDEAAQISESGVLAALSIKSERYVLVGDPKQLSATVHSQEAKSLGYDRSLFERLQSQGYPSHMLRTQHRMHQQISRFPGKYFYAGLLRDSNDIRKLGGQPFCTGLDPYIFYDVENGEEQDGGKSAYNEVECRACLLLYYKVKKVEEGQKAKISIGVITPYASQVDHLRRVFKQSLSSQELKKISFSTIDGFQGQEKDVIIMTCVKTARLGFVDDPRRINVALTRAKMALWILGKESNLLQCEHWRALISDAKKIGCYRKMIDLTEGRAGSYRNFYLSDTTTLPR